MKKILFIAALALLCGCGKTSKVEERETSARFAIERHETNSMRNVYVLSDNETGAEYLLVFMGYGGVAVVSKQAQQ